MNFARTQFLSLVTKAATTVLGVIQSVIVVRLLSKGEFGLIGLVMSIGGVIGVSQNLGIVDGTIREIAVLQGRGKREIAKVFWVSLMVRQAVTIPLSLFLIVSAAWIAGIYHRPEIIPYIQLFAASLILQGFQDVMGATLTGTKKFTALYLVQTVTAAINIFVFAYLSKTYGVSGFFWSVIITTSIMVVWFGYLIFNHLRGFLALPDKQDFIMYGRRVLRIGLYMYLSRIFFVIWQRLPLLLLGGILAAQELGDINVSLTFGSKLTIIAAALSEVNLSWLSSLFASEKKEFERIVGRTMHRVLVLMALLTFVLLFFTPEIVQYVIGSQYAAAQPMILVITLAFFLYSLTDIGTSSLFVSADQPKLRAQVFAVMTAITGITVAISVWLKADALLASWFVFVGALAAFVMMVAVAKRKFGISLLTVPLMVILIGVFATMLWLLSVPHLLPRVIMFLIFTGALAWETRRSELLPTWLAAWLPLMKKPEATFTDSVTAGPKFICFAGAQFDQPSWTNRQHMTTRVSAQHPVLYIEPRVWIVRYFLTHWNKPASILHYMRRLFWYERKSANLYIKSQWNLIPMSREIKVIAAFNHYLNRFLVYVVAWRLGFTTGKTVLWIYDTEAAEFLSAFPKATVVYDCVDNHAVQAGVDRNSQRVREEEEKILSRADVVTVTSHRLLKLKKKRNPHTYLLLNAGDVSLYKQPPAQTDVLAAIAALHDIPRPLIGFVGALDAYKIDINLLQQVGKHHPHWHFVLIGAPAVDRDRRALAALKALPNMHFLGAIERTHVPAYVAQCNCCIIPYRNNSYNEASFPLKFWEFMASGKPIVASGLPELLPYKDVIGYANSAEEFAQQITAWLEHPQLQQAERIQQALANTWEHRCREFLRIINEYL
jgi:O-antigen/teichoic acid export membrane protein/glycosyltransferase involved in cell wall biosynthesis